KNDNGIGHKTLPASQQSNNGQYDNTNLVKKDANPVDYIGGRIAIDWAVAPDWNLLVSESFQRVDSEGSFATQEYSYDYKPIPKLSATLFEPNYNKDQYYNTAWT
ncbi:hypothetical protein, partial [Enterococcus faecalis]|uniref:hypothetical protein n=1 Tax=Enterococcus faecalis TaxID=1351 RepID=UPI00403F43C2